VRIGICTSDRSVSLQNVANDIVEVLRGKGHLVDLHLFAKVEPLFYEKYDSWLTVMTFDIVWAVPYFFITRQLKVNGVNALFYATIEGKVWGMWTREWVVRDLEFVACSQYVKRKLHEVGAKVVSVVPHGVKLKEYSLASPLGRIMRKRLGFSDNDFVVVYIAGDYPRKGHPLFAEVCRIVAQKDKSVKFVVATKDDALASYAGCENVVALDWFGKAPRSDIIALYGACDIYAQPSLAEGFGLPVLEALASGKPVIHPDYQPLSEITDKDTSFRVPVRMVEDHRGDVSTMGGIMYEHHLYDPSEFAEILLQAKEEVLKRRDELADLCRKRAQLFDAEKVYSKFEVLLR